MKKIRLLLLLVCFLKSVSVFSQFDTEFWFAIPYVTTNHDKNNQYRLVFATADKPSEVTISLPANAVFTPVTFDISANSHYIYNFSEKFQSAYVFPLPNGNVILKTGIKITATEPVFCYYENYTPLNQSQLNTEIWSLKGKNALGTEFVLPFQNTLHNDDSFYPEARSYFYIVATEDNTEVKITTTKGIDGYSTPSTFSKTLNVGEVYVGRAVSGLAENRPVGTQVTATKKVAITISDDSMLIKEGTNTGRDVGGDQLIPVDLLGTEYISVQGYLNAPSSNELKYDQVLILAVKPGQTNVTIDGGTPIPLNQWEVHKYTYPNNPNTTTTGACHITTDQPAYVYQLSGFEREVGYSILPPIGCRGSNTVAVMRSSDEPFYLTLLVDSAYIDGFSTTPAGVIYAINFKPIPNTGGAWMYLRQEIFRNQVREETVVRVDNNKGVFHMGIIHGKNGKDCKFGYFSDFAQSKFKILMLKGKNVACIGDTLKFTSNEIPSTDYKWYGPNGYTHNAPLVNISNIQPSDEGWYKITGNTENCDITPDSIYISVISIPEAKFGVEDHCTGISTVVVNETVNLGNMNYTWNFGDSTPNVNGVNPTHTYKTSGTYTIKLWAETQGCKDSTMNLVTLTMIASGRDTGTICAGENYNLNGHILTQTGDYMDTVKNSDGCDSVIYFHLIVLDTVQTFIKDSICYGEDYDKNGFKLPAQFKSGTYRLPLQTHYDCDSTVILDLTILPEMIVNLLPDRMFCEFDFKPYLLNADIGDYHYEWNTGATTSHINIGIMPTGTHTYMVTVTNSLNCQATGEHTLTIHPTPSTIEIISHTEDYCDRNMAILEVITDGMNILWNTGETDNMINVYHSGTYSVVSSIGNCEISTNYTIEGCPCYIYIPNSFSPNEDGVNDYFYPKFTNSIVDIEMAIYNRSGYLVYYTNLNEPWDGKVKGKTVPIGVYTYLITYKCQTSSDKVYQKTGMIFVLN